MKCDICSGESEKGFMIFGQGFVCSEDCSQIAQSRRKAWHDELLAEALNEMPESLSTGAFERWSLKFALHFLKSLSEADRAKIGKSNPMLLIPEQLALDFKERILRQIHPAYISEIEYKGHSRLFCGGEYCFRQNVPAEKIVEACRKAELIN
jgi:hypothetical protein